MSKWIESLDIKPEVGVAVLGYDHDSDRLMIVFVGEDERLTSDCKQVFSWYTQGKKEKVNVTHWTSIPRLLI